MGVDLSKFTLVLDENFDSDLSIFNGTSGIWSTGPRRDALVTNSPTSVFLSSTTPTSDGLGVGIDPFKVENGILKISSGLIPQENLAAVQDALTLAGQDQYADQAKYYTGRIATDQTWGQQYGFFEIKAQIPEGKGHWPAFWLAPAGEGWPPEIDIFEAYGRGIGKATGSDNSFTVATYFDGIDGQGNKTQDTNITNPYATGPNGEPETPDVKDRQGHEISKFGTKIDALDQFGADIYDGYWTWATAWTPEGITYYFGRDHDHLVEIYKTPTPQDSKAPMYLIANDQIGSNFGWNPVPGEEASTFAPDNTFNIDYIKMYALNPTTQLYATAPGATMVDDNGDTMIHGTTGNDRIVTHGGQDMIDLKGGTDSVFVEHGLGNKVISGFGADDRIVLDGFFFDDVADVMARLTQAGGDVWLANGADPGNPQTISFKDRTVASFSADDFVVRWSTTKDIWTSALHDDTRMKDGDGDGIVRAATGGSKMTDTGSAFKGAMVMAGSSQGDLYYVYKANTVIKEAVSGGVDTVYAFKDYVLPDNVENLIIVTPKDGQIATGNALGNRLEGTTAAEVFVGGKGDDLVVTGGGADRISYSAGDGYDTVVGFGSDDVMNLHGLRFASYDELKARLTASGHDTLLDLGTGQSVTFRDTTIDNFSAANFTFDVGATNVVGHGVDPNYVASQSTAGVSFDPPKDPTPPVVVPPVIDEPGRQGIDLTGGNGNDLLRASLDQNYRITGGAGNDVVRGKGGNDLLSGDAGNDKLNGGLGNDALHGGLGNDKLAGEGGGDLLYGEDGNDRLIGGDGNDTLWGGVGSDSLSGDGGNDILYGGLGLDTLKGGAGNDILDSSSGSDRLFGESGADRFVISAHAPADIVRIMDYASSAGDSIDISAIFSVDVTSANFSDFVHLVQVKGNLSIQVDLDGHGSAYGFDTLATVVHSTAGDVSHGLIY